MKKWSRKYGLEKSSPYVWTMAHRFFWNGFLDLLYMFVPSFYLLPGGK
jgi:hypothetical protein